MTKQENWAKGCLGKKRYDTAKFVNKVIKKVEADRGVKLTSYYCMSCFGYHMTKQPGKNLRSVTF